MYTKADCGNKVFLPGNTDDVKIAEIASGDGVNVTLTIVDDEGILGSFTAMAFDLHNAISAVDGLVPDHDQSEVYDLVARWRQVRTAQAAIRKSRKQQTGKFVGILVGKDSWALEYQTLHNEAHAIMRELLGGESLVP